MHSNILENPISQERIVRKAYLFDPHTWYGDKVVLANTRNNRYSLESINHVMRPIDPAYLVFFDEFSSSNLPLFFPRSRRIAVLKENPIHTRTIPIEIVAKRFDLVLTHRKDLIQRGSPFKRLEYSSNWLDRSQGGECLNKKSKLASFIGDITHLSGYPGHDLRKLAYLVCSNSPSVDCYGRGIRELQYKCDALDDYCFSVAIENSREDYYFSEKLIDCLMSKTIPIYWGCPSIDEIFDSKGMLCFETMNELKVILKGLSMEKYKSMLSFVEHNKDICEHNMLNSFEGYLSRMLETIEQFVPYPQRRLAKLRISKGMAGLRYLGVKL